jgi:hypothetical protein
VVSVVPVAVLAAQVDEIYFLVQAYSDSALAQELSVESALTVVWVGSVESEPQLQVVVFLAVQLEESVQLERAAAVVLVALGVKQSTQVIAVMPIPFVLK